MFTFLKTACRGNRSTAARQATVLVLAQSIVWAGVMIAVAAQLRDSPAQDTVTMLLTLGASTCLMLASLPFLRGRRDDDGPR